MNLCIALGYFNPRATTKKLLQAASLAGKLFASVFSFSNKPLSSANLSISTNLLNQQCSFLLSISLG